MLIVDQTFCTLERHDQTQVGRLLDFVHKQDLGYPRYHEWVERTEDEIRSGSKTAIVTYIGRELVGDLIYQTHKVVSPLLEIKNLRIDARFRDEGAANLMLKKLAKWAKGRYEGIIVDVREDQPSTIAFMSRAGFSEAAILPLYEEDRREVVMFKPLGIVDYSSLLGKF